MSFDDVDAITEHGWTVAGSQAYPAFYRFGKQGTSLTAAIPEASDRSWLEGSLTVVNTYVRQNHAKIMRSIVPPAALVIQFNTVAGPAAAGFRIPVSPYTEG